MSNLPTVFLFEDLRWPAAAAQQKQAQGQAFWPSKPAALHMQLASCALIRYLASCLFFPGSVGGPEDPVYRTDFFFGHDTAVFCVTPLL